MLTPEEVRHIAMLARLGLSDQEVEALRLQLSDVLDHIAMLDNLDTSQIEPTAHIQEHRQQQMNVSRPDYAVPSLEPAQVLRNAPRSEDGFIRVPTVLEEVKAAILADGNKEGI